MLDEGVAVAKVASNLNVTEGAIRHHITNGKLKKKGHAG
jgi:DNA-binding NarL/FixJ family response regulator